MAPHTSSRAGLFAMLLFAGVTPLGCAAPPRIDGGWTGTYRCDADTKTLSAIFEEDEEGNLAGEMFVDFQIVFLGTPILLTGRAELVGAERNADDTYEGTADVLDNAQGIPDWSFAMEPNARFDELSGTFSQLDGSQNPVRDCDLDLEITNVPDGA